MKKLILIILLVPCLAHAYILAGVIGSSGVPGTYVPNTPAPPTATPGFSQTSLSWSAPATDGTHNAATGYTLYGGVSASPTTSIYTGSATSYTHTGLTGGVPYYYRLTANNAGGASGYSSPDATATPTTLPYFSDTFARADGLSLGSNWTQTGSNFSILSNALHYNEATAGDQHAMVNGISSVNGEILAKMYVARVSDTAPYPQVNLVQRRTALNNYFCARATASVGGTSVAVVKWVAGVGAGVGTSYTLSPPLTVGNYYWIRYRLSGSNEHQVRIWKDGTSEPSVWNIDTTDASITSAGSVGVATGDAVSQADVVQFTFQGL